MAALDYTRAQQIAGTHGRIGQIFAHMTASFVAWK